MRKKRSKVFEACGHGRPRGRVGLCRPLIIPFGILALGCGAADADQDVAATTQDLIRLQFADSFALIREITFPDAGPLAVGSIRSLDVDGAGRLLIADSRAQNLKLYDRLGGHLLTIGRSGRGPGEFEVPIDAKFGRMGELVAIDAGAARISVFDSTGRFLNAIPTTGQDARALVALHDGRIVVVGLTGFQKANQLVAVYDREGGRRSFHQIHPLVLTLDLLVSNAWGIRTAGDTLVVGSSIAYEAHQYTASGRPVGHLPPQAPTGVWTPIRPEERPRSRNLQAMTDWLGRASVMWGAGVVHGRVMLAVAPRSSEEKTQLVQLDGQLRPTAVYSSVDGRFAYASSSLLALVRSDSVSMVSLRLYTRRGR